METTPTIGSIVEVRATGHRGTFQKIGGASINASGDIRPVLLVSAYHLHGGEEDWSCLRLDPADVDLVLEAKGQDVCLYCWGPIPAERIPQPRWAGATPPPRTKASHYCTAEHQKADARWVSANAAALRKAYDRTPNGKGGLAPSAKKPGPGRQVITPPPAGATWNDGLQEWAAPDKDQPESETDVWNKRWLKP